jgi:hypothetical protein
VVEVEVVRQLLLVGAQVVVAVVVGQLLLKVVAKPVVPLEALLSLLPQVCPLWHHHLK